jgi:Periplasmic binding protein
MDTRYPHRIVCLTEEPTEVLSRFTVRPPQARRDKPRVSAFTDADMPAILELEPDLVIGFSDIQTNIAKELIAAGIEVWIANHRTVAGILSYVRRLGAMVGAAERADTYARDLEAHIDEVRAAAALLPRRPNRGGPRDRLVDHPPTRPGRPWGRPRRHSRDRGPVGTGLAAGAQAPAPLRIPDGNPAHGEPPGPGRQSRQRRSDP